ncbi:phosphatidate cytidylyltransferase [Candidatus Eisenbacteria bacterium]|uniref:Phosphatidate cytidylyltransferase n=1 Tax=Eiseniibacteriota bacterium TaxID=2212470 RepID=A0ABV6YQ09_UNCEI
MDASPPAKKQRPEPAREPAGKARKLLIRALAGLVLIPIVLLLNHAGGLIFAGFVALLAAMACREFYALFGDRVPSPLRLVGILGSALICLAFHFGSLDGGALAALLLLAAVLLASLLRQDQASFATAASLGLTGPAYTGWLLGFFVLLRATAHGPAASPNAGRDYVLMVLLLTWSYDTLAYLGGSFLGRRKFFTRISPSKTLEGTLIGLAGSIAAALVCRSTFAGYFGWAEAAGLGLLIGVAAQTGDLVESMFKRSARAKDSSNLIPGHGGVLDRSDSLLLTAPMFYLYIRVLSNWT